MDSTKTLELDAALATLPAQHSAPSVAAALGDQHAAAVAIGKRWRLDCTDGTWLCAGCAREYAPFHVSLHCPGCLHEARVARVGHLLAEARVSDEERRWKGMHDAILSDSRMTSELARGLLTKARELPSVTKSRLSALNLAYDKRFARPAPSATWDTYTGSEPTEEWDRE